MPIIIAGILFIHFANRHWHNATIYTMMALFTAFLIAVIAQQVWARR
jgi:uncharacterized membrane protein YozB (DUF420 family)